MCRNGIRATALLGLLFCAISGVSFLVNETDASPLYLVALLTLFPAVVSSFVAGHLSLRRIRFVTPRTPPLPPRTVTIRQLLQSDFHVRRVQWGNVNVPTLLRSVFRQPSFWLVGIMVFYAAYIFLMERVMESYIGSIHFGAAVNCLLAPVPVLTLLYGVMSKDERKMKDGA